VKCVANANNARLYGFGVVMPLVGVVSYCSSKWSHR
jgi:hypothetical protein